MYRRVVHFDLSSGIYACVTQALSATRFSRVPISNDSLYDTWYPSSEILCPLTNAAVAIASPYFTYTHIFLFYKSPLIYTFAISLSVQRFAVASALSWAFKIFSYFYFIYVKHSNIEIYSDFYLLDKLYIILLLREEEEKKCSSHVIELCIYSISIKGAKRFLASMYTIFKLSEIKRIKMDIGWGKNKNFCQMYLVFEYTYVSKMKAGLLSEFFFYLLNESQFYLHQCLWGKFNFIRFI